VGILYASVKLQQEMQRDHVIKRLVALGIKENKEGVSIHKLNYRELKYELVMASFRD